MSLPSSDRSSTPAGVRVAQSFRTLRDTGGLDDTPAGDTDRDALLEHLGRNVMHASVDRSFQKSYRSNEDGVSQPKYYRVNSDAFKRCQYVMLTTKQYAPVLVVDIDQQGTPGGHPANLALEVRQNLAMLIQCELGPSWVGINPLSGKAQAIWLIDPVYADEGGTSRNMTLLSATTRALGEMLDHDPHFSHRFSRNPFYTGDDPTAYRWYCQHKRVHRLAYLLKEVRAMTGQSQHEKTPRQQFTSGRELINAVKARREEAQAFKALAKDVENELGDELDQYDPELIDGVRILWSSQSKAARDETAFRHALKTGHRLRAAGERLTDAALIDAYEHAYNIAHRYGADGRDNEMPPMRDRQTMARRVRGYVTQSKTIPGRATTSQRATTTERKALATMGRRGGQKAAQRWKTDPDGEYAQTQRETLKEANKRRAVKGQGTRGKVLSIYSQTLFDTGKAPSARQIAEEIGCERSTVARHISALRKSGMIDD